MQEITSYIPLIIVMVLFVVIMYFFMVRGPRRARQEHSQLVEGLKRWDKVITAGGIYGEIEFIDEGTVILKLEEGAKMRVLRQSIVRKQSE